jgi:hypothetical protein
MQPVYSEKNEGEIINNLLQTENELTGWILYFRKQQIDMNRTKGKNPLIKWLPMSIADLLLVLDAHQSRHIWQIETTLSGKKYSTHSRPLFLLFHCHIFQDLYYLSGLFCNRKCGSINLF